MKTKQYWFTMVLLLLGTVLFLFPVAPDLGAQENIKIGCLFAVTGRASLWESQRRTQ
jgi:hypothetical protein